MILTSKSALLVISLFCIIGNGKKIRLRILQGSSCTRMAWQQMGSCGPCEDFRERSRALQRAVSQHPVGLGKSAVAGSPSVDRRWYNPPGFVSGCPSTDGILGYGFRQDTSASCRVAHQLGAREFRYDNVKPPETGITIRNPKIIL